MPARAKVDAPIDEPPAEILPTPSGEDPGSEEGQQASAAALAGVTPPKGWFAVDSEETPAPDSGKPIWMSDGTLVAEAYRRHSRRRSKVNGRWEEFAYWAAVNGAGQAVPFEPLFWRPSNALIAE